MLASHLSPEGLRLPGATASDIAQCAQNAAITFPHDYKAFLLQSDGYNGPVGRGYLNLWSIREFSPDNSGYELGEDMGGIFYIGSNGGPTAYGVDWSTGEPVYISVPFVPAERSEVRLLGKTLSAFVGAISAGEGW
jgi:hypothetical protein